MPSRTPHLLAACLLAPCLLAMGVACSQDVPGEQPHGPDADAGPDTSDAGLDISDAGFDISDAEPDSDRWIATACDEVEPEPIHLHDPDHGQWTLALPGAVTNYTEATVGGATAENR